MIPFVIFLAILILVPILYSCADTLTCSLRGLIWSSTFTILDPIFVFTQWAIISSILVFFSKKETFRSWLKLAVWAIPLALVFIFITPVSSSAYMDFFPFYRDDAARLAGGLFAVASLVLLLFGLVRAHMYKSDKEKYDASYADAEIKGLKLVFATGIGFLSVAVVSWMLFYKLLPLSLFGLFLASGIVAILSNIYALLYVVTLSYQKARTHTPFGWKLILSQSLLGITAIIIFVTGLVATSS